LVVLARALRPKPEAIQARKVPLWDQEAIQARKVPLWDQEAIQARKVPLWDQEAIQARKVPLWDQEGVAVGSRSMQRADVQTSFCRGEACFARRERGSIQAFFRPITTLRLLKRSILDLSGPAPLGENCQRCLEPGF
jgi:tellurite resistance-related uncharacterized protein